MSEEDNKISSEYITEGRTLSDCLKPEVVRKALEKIGKGLVGAIIGPIPLHSPGLYPIPKKYLESPVHEDTEIQKRIEHVVTGGRGIPKHLFGFYRGSEAVYTKETDLQRHLLEMEVRDGNLPASELDRFDAKQWANFLPGRNYSF